MSMKFIGIERHYDHGRQQDTSSLMVSDRHPDKLGVVGVLNHGMDIRPKNDVEADKLRQWLDANYASQQVMAIENAMAMLHEAIPTVSTDTRATIIEVLAQCHRAIYYSHLPVED